MAELLDFVQEAIDMSVRLVVLTAGKWRGQTILVKQFPVLIGRGPDCHLRLTSPLISLHHCTLVSQEGRIYVHDADSDSGTLLNDEKIRGDAALTHGDRLRLGPVELYVRIETGPGVSEPTPLPPTKEVQAEEEDAAALLFSIQDESTPSSSTLTIEDKSVPAESAAAGMSPPDQPANPEPEKPKPPPRAPADTKKAASTLLQKYLRRSPL